MTDETSPRLPASWPGQTLGRPVTVTMRHPI